MKETNKTYLKFKVYDVDKYLFSIKVTTDEEKYSYKEIKTIATKKALEILKEMDIEPSLLDLELEELGLEV